MGGYGPLIVNWKFQNFVWKLSISLRRIFPVCFEREKIGCYYTSNPVCTDPSLKELWHWFGSFYMIWIVCEWLTLVGSELRQGWDPFMLKLAGGGKQSSTYVALSCEPWKIYESKIRLKKIVFENMNFNYKL